MIRGRYTFNSKFPCDAANPIAVSLPITCTAAMVIASHCVGFTFPGMILEPGSFSGIRISPRPHRGPLASQRISLAIFMQLAASAFNAPCAKLISSRELKTWNLFGSDSNVVCNCSDKTAHTSLPKLSGAFNPVPTAVPPIASLRKEETAIESISILFSSMLLHPLISSEKRSGVASCRCVRPILMICLFSSSKRFITEIMFCTSCWSFWMPNTAAICIAVGNVSFELWLLFTSSFGCNSFLPHSIFPRLAITSFTFILLCVPLPVCHTDNGKWLSSFLSIISKAACLIISFFSSLNNPFL